MKNDDFCDITSQRDCYIDGCYNKDNIGVTNMMITKSMIIEYCLTLKDTFEDYPFNEDFETTAMKHSKSKKWFALLMYVGEKLYVNVKTNLEYSDLLRSTYNYIIPAYHMNKEHWNSVIINECLDFDLLKELIKESYELTNK